jgi:hypothetical protein
MNFTRSTIIVMIDEDARLLRRRWRTDFDVS